MRNLRIEELFAGAWVQQFKIEPGAVTLPMCVFGVWKNGRLWLDRDDKEPFDTVIDKVYPIPVDSRMLEGFGFVKAKGDNVWLKCAGDMRLTVALRMRGGVEIPRRCAITGKIACWHEEIRYFHELQRWWNDRVFFPFGISLDLKWHGFKEKKEELV